MSNHTIWSMHREVDENVPQENNDDVAMPDVALHKTVTNEEAGVNMQHVATVNDMFRNTLADNTEQDNAFLSCYVT